MKRKRLIEVAESVAETVAQCTRSKRPKLWSGTLPTMHTKLEYISATQTRNYMLNDPLVDWLKVHGHHSHTGHNENGGFTSFIMEKGVEFEAELVKYINMHKLPIVTVSNYITNESVKKTINLMKEGVPVIHSAPIRNIKNRTHGILDLLVRSDYLHRLIDECPLTDQEKIIGSPKLGHSFHYLVIDVKFSTLPLRADGRHLLNSGSYPAYKSQCLIYNNAIGLIQGYTPRYAYILGRRWRYTKKDIKYDNYTCLNKLGVIDFHKVDKSYIERTNKALKWIRDNKKYGHQWSVSPPSCPELYPNMCHDSGNWQKHKQIIAEDIGEITSVWYCGVKHRNIALNNGITSWRDPDCTSQNIGINGTRASVIDSILSINRQDIDKIRPKKIRNNMFQWKTPTNEMFVDFETLSDIFSSFSELPRQVSTDMIFMIGVLYKQKTNSEWTYKRFTCNQPSYEEEYRIMNEFVEFVKEHKNPKLWYWCAENRFWRRSENRQFDIATEQDDEKKTDHISDNWKLNNWADMCELFKYEPIVVKDCFKFGLKPISESMRKHNLIKTKMESECTSGITAMVKAWKCYKEFSDPANCQVMQDIARYNKFDVCVLEDILSYLRANHT